LISITSGPPLIWEAAATPTAGMAEQYFYWRFDILSQCEEEEAVTC